jgi:hypothetical protein
MSILSQAFKAGKLFVWEANGRPQLMKLPENIYKASVGVDHIVAIGESGYLCHHLAISTPSDREPMVNSVTETQKTRSSPKYSSTSPSTTSRSRMQSLEKDTPSL